MALLEARAGMGHLVRELVVRGPLDLDALRRSIARLQRRYAALRVSVDVSQRALVPCDAQVEVRLCEDEAAEQTMGLELNTPLAPFETVRVTVASEQPDQFRIWISVHHAVIDGRWLNRVCAELIESYDSMLRGDLWHGGVTPGRLADPVETLIWGASAPDPRPGFEAFLARQAEAIVESPPVDLPAASVAPSTGSRSWVVSGAMGLRGSQSGRAIVAALGASLLAQARTLLPGHGVIPLAFAMTVDLGARIRPRPVVPGMYVSGIRTTAQVSGDGGPPHAVRAQLAESVAAALDRGDAELGVLAQRAAVEYHLDTGRAPAAVTLSYLGDVPMPTTTEVRLASLRAGVPMHGFGPTLYCHAARMGDELTCHLVFPEPAIDRAQGAAALGGALRTTATLLGAERGARASTDGRHRG